MGYVHRIIPESFTGLECYFHKFVEWFNFLIILKSYARIQSRCQTFWCENCKYLETVLGSVQPPARMMVARS